jgi:hypothetical protein
MDSYGFGWDPVVSYFKHGNETKGSVKGWEIL